MLLLLLAARCCCCFCFAALRAHASSRSASGAVAARKEARLQMRAQMACGALVCDWQRFFKREQRVQILLQRQAPV